MSRAESPYSLVANRDECASNGKGGALLTCRRLLDLDPIGVSEGKRVSPRL
jgi:hypothetical protein